MFLREIPEFAAQPAPFRGLLHFSADQPTIGVTALRGTYNERADFLISTLPVVGAQDRSAFLIVPHMVVGGGYTTQLVLFNASDGASLSGTIGFFSQSGEPRQLEIQDH